jgi:hypothetical protein
MSISYPVSSGGGGTTVISQRAQYAIPATINTTFPVVVSGTTTPTEIATFFLPPTFLYQMSGSYTVVAVGYITGASGVTGSLELVGDEITNAFLTEYDPLGAGNSAMGIKFSGSSGYFSVNYPLNLGPGADYGASLPITFSGSVSNYTASIYGIYLSPTV